MANRFARALDALLGKDAPPPVEQTTQQGVDGAALTGAPPPVRNVDPLADPNWAAMNAAMNDVRVEKTLTLAKTRQGRYREMERLELEIPALSAALKKIKRLATASDDDDARGFTIECDVAGVVDTLETLFRRTKMRDNIGDWVYRLLFYGDTFTEIVFAAPGGKMQVARLKNLRPGSMVRDEDGYGQLKSPAFRQIDGKGDVLATFEPWQLIHTRWNRLGDDPYGRPHFLAGRPAGFRLSSAMSGLAVARRESAYTKVVHYVDVTGQTTEEGVWGYVRKYIRHLRQKKEVDDDGTVKLVDGTQDGVTTDFYVPTRSVGQNQKSPPKVGVEALATANPGLTNLGDIEFHQREFLMAGEVPPALLGIEKDVNAKATVTNQEKNFASLIEEVQSVTAAFVRLVCDMELLLNGIDPASVDYRVVMPTPNTANRLEEAQAEAQETTAKKTALDAGVYSRKDWALGRPIDGLTEAEWEERQQDIADEQAIIDEHVARMNEEFAKLSGSGSDGGGGDPPPNDAGA